MTLYVIYEKAPASTGQDELRMVEMFDRKEHAQTVLDALESVNILFNNYVIVERKDK